MEVRLAEYTGFCFGVKRAVDTVYEQIKNGKTIYTYGSIVNNEEVVKDLVQKGVRVLESKEELTALPDGTPGTERAEAKTAEADAQAQAHAGEKSQRREAASVIIRAHGVPEEIYGILKEKKLECIDATCPFVRRIQKKAEEESRNGRHVVIVGNAGHPEVEGIIGRSEEHTSELQSPA